MYLVIARIDTYILCMKESRNISYKGRRMIKYKGSRTLQHRGRIPKNHDIGWGNQLLDTLSQVHDFSDMIYYYFSYLEQVKTKMFAPIYFMPLLADIYASSQKILGMHNSIQMIQDMTVRYSLTLCDGVGYWFHDYIPRLEGKKILCDSLSHVNIYEQ